MNLMIQLIFKVYPKTDVDFYCKPKLITRLKNWLSRGCCKHASLEYFVVLMLKFIAQSRKSVKNITSSQERFI